MTSLRGIGLGYFLAIAIVSGYAFFTNCALAQITPDRTLPKNSNVTTEGNTFNITGGTQAGSNLFHSFQEFSVPTNSTALFKHAADIQNILTRVTGRSISNIDGLIKASGIANLFLINPNGIIFGKNARLDLGGSFLATTASNMKFADGTDFSATPNPTTTPLLSINVPIGLQYGNNTESIQVQEANLQVTPGKTLALAGGNVEINGGQLLAAGGRVELAGVAEQGSVGLNSNSSNLGLNFPDAELRKDVSMRNG
ncbi:MAG: filamentous hemagglutinin N-terminal domain-containing protein, partial [Fischerella sp.]|nr:filamentous hemagglutinin N-terminal domain-containing protein [Fischerella sp.]